MNGDELQPLRRAVGAGEDAIWISVATTQGSVPREAGTGMVVTSAGTWGSIGGGHLEYEAVRIAREALATVDAPAPSLLRFPLAARLGQCCGGVATLAFTGVAAGTHAWLDAACAWRDADTPFAIVTAVEGTRSGVIAVAPRRHEGSLGDVRLDDAIRLALRPDPASHGGITHLDGIDLLVRAVRPEHFHVAVFGNGHVGRALVHLLGVLPFDVRWIDEREADFPAAVAANIRVVTDDDPASAIASLPAGSAVVVTTHSHAIDFEIVRAALSRDDLAYVGMIGSTAKRRQFEGRALARGLDASSLSRLTCPIGHPLFVGKEPGVVALAVAAQLQALCQKRAGIEPRRREPRERDPDASFARAEHR